MKKDKYAKQKILYFRVKCLQQKFSPHIALTGDKTDLDLDLDSLAKEEQNKGLLGYIKVTPRSK